MKRHKRLITAHHMAELVVKRYNLLDLDVTKEYLDLPSWDRADDTLSKFITSISRLETYCHHHFTTFKMTDLVYYWSKHICLLRIKFDNYYRAYGFGYHNRKLAYKKWGLGYWA